MKRLFIALAFAGLLSPAYSAGTIPLSLSQQFGADSKPLANCFLYIIQAGTTSTPQNAYQDLGLTQVLPNPMRCDSAGRLPQFFLADGLIKIRLTDANGVSQSYPNGAAGAIDNIQVIGPSGGGGGGGTVDATTVLATGDVKSTYGTGVLTGFVRMNGRTIGSATSGATERANADTQALFIYLWGVDTTLTVSTGRGASASADWAANKTMALPDARGRALAGLNDMGSTNASVLAPLAVTKGDTITLGSLMGYGGSRSLLTANLPPYTPTGTFSGTVSGTAAGTGKIETGLSFGGAGQALGQASTGNTLDGWSLGVSGTASGSVSMNAQGGTSAAFDTVSPLMLITLYIKL